MNQGVTPVTLQFLHHSFRHGWLLSRGQMLSLCVTGPKPHTTNGGLHQSQDKLAVLDPGMCRLLFFLSENIPMEKSQPSLMELLSLGSWHLSCFVTDKEGRCGIFLRRLYCAPTVSLWLELCHEDSWPQEIFRLASEPKPLVWTPDAMYFSSHESPTLHAFPCTSFPDPWGSYRAQ